jgi:hypothetical protein
LTHSGYSFSDIPCMCAPCLQIGLVLLDEVHLLNESGRGSSLEAGCVCRIKAVAALPEMTGSHLASVRFVAVSATIPNISDVSAHPGCCWVTTGKPLHAYLWPMDMQRHSLAIFAVTFLLSHTAAVRETSSASLSAGV